MVSRVLSKMINAYYVGCLGLILLLAVILHIMQGFFEEFPLIFLTHLHMLVAFVTTCTALHESKYEWLIVFS